MWTRILTAIGVAVFVAVVYLSVMTSRSGNTSPEARKSSLPVKKFSTEVAEGFRYRDFENFGVDLLAFESCRIEKMRRGAVTFGAFNVLVLDNVVITLPPGDKDAEPSEPGEAERKMDMSNMDDFITLFQSIQGMAGKKFSGMRVNGLSVNRLEDGKTQPLFSAGLAESGIGKGGHIQLEGCVVHSPSGAEEAISSARIELKPAPALVYKKGGIEQRLAL